jgi:hypothetical protein
MKPTAMDHEGLLKNTTAESRKVLKGALEAWPRASDVKFAHPHDDWVLRFTYRDSPWFAVVSGEEVKVTIPTDTLHDHKVGTFDVRSESLLDEIQEAIEKVICPPIRVTKWGDRIVFDQRKNDDDLLGNEGFSAFVATHAECGGVIDVHPISSVYRVLACRLCNLRVPVPRWVKEIRELRSWSMGLETGESWVPMGDG